MKQFYVLSFYLLVTSLTSNAQWLDTSNQFKDSLHMPVSVAVRDQKHTIVVKGDDGSYFMVWQDTRNAATSKTDIYAQKFDRDGKRLWTVDGVPVAIGANDELFQSAQNVDYRRYSYAAPDGAGGLYVCWNYNTVISPYTYWGISVQHLHADGSRVWGDEGKGIGVPVAGAAYDYLGPQLVTDEHGGFFIAYITTPGNNRDCYAYCYKDEGGTLKSYGGGQMDQYGKEIVSNTACGVRYDVSFAFDAAVQSFMLYPNQQGGCNIIMSIATNAQQMWLGYNRLARVKKDCHTTTRRRGPNSDDPTTSYLYTADYTKDQVVRVYNFKTYNYQTTCRPIDHPDDIVTYTNTRIENNGYGWEPLNISGPKYAVNLPQGVILQTGGNINAEIISSYERELVGSNSLSDYHIHAYYHLNEIYDSIPYELCTDLDHPYLAYRPTLPDNAIPTDTLLGGPDSLISHPLGSQDAYTFNGSGNKAWVTTRGSQSGNGTSVYLQELKLVSAGTKKYKFAINTSDNAGLKIGQEISTGFSGTDVYYNTPSIATDSNGNGLFYVNESGRFARVSPITDGGVLAWGAMGKPIGSGFWAGRPLDNENPMAVLSANGKAVIAWETDRQTGNSDGYNVWMERVSDVFTPAYLPPLQTLMATGTTNGQSVPAYLNGTTHTWTTISQLVYKNPVGNIGTTPIVSILDDYPLGFVKLKTYENTNAIRIVNGVPYLDRNILITVDNNPHGSGNIRMRFYIPQAQFDALKTAVPSIVTPADLGVIDQPNATTTLPSIYTPTGNEETLPITSWGTQDGGYYVETVVHGFSNFFITKGSTPLPLKWLDVKGFLTTPTAAAITWTVTEEHNIKGYTVEYSSDGINYLAGCSSPSGNSGSSTAYSCNVSLPAPGTYTFRVRQEDIDGRTTYSKTVVLSSSAATALVVSPNPVTDDAIVRIPAGMTIRKLILLSVDGKVVWQSAGAFSGTVSIPMGTLPAGIYYLEAATVKDLKIVEIIRR